MMSLSPLSIDRFAELVMTLSYPVAIRDKSDRPQKLDEPTGFLRHSSGKHSNDPCRLYVPLAGGSGVRRMCVE